MSDEKLRERARNINNEQDRIRCRLLVCHSSPCRIVGAEEVYQALRQAVSERSLAAEVEVDCIGCTAHCADGPLVKVCVPGKDDALYELVTAESAIRILEEHFPGCERTCAEDTTRDPEPCDYE